MVAIHLLLIPMMILLFFGSLLILRDQSGQDQPLFVNLANPLALTLKLSCMHCAILSGPQTLSSDWLRTSVGVEIQKTITFMIQWDVH